MFEEEKITLDKETFKALSSDTRIKILKLLSKRRMTLTEVAKFLDMSVSSIKEHLQGLEGADLVKQMDEGHKWKYYQLTTKGKKLINPMEKRVMIVLGLSAVVAIGGLYRMFAPAERVFSAMSGAADSKLQQVAAPVMEAAAETAQTAQTATALAFDPVLFAVILIAVMVFGISLGVLLDGRKGRKL